MPSIVVISKTGVASQGTMAKGVESLHRKLGFSSDTGFCRRVTWKVGGGGCFMHVSLYAKDTGRAGQENKYELPPPVDTQLYFGKIGIVAATDEEGENIVDLPLDVWQTVCEKLFGGFEDLGSEDSSDEENEEDEIAPELLTKHGYLKDGFVVDSASDVDALDETASDDDNSELSAEDYESDASIEMFTSNS